MSTYENYDKASGVYDSQRTAAGVDVMAAMLQFYSGKELKDLHLLDAGCGTGNYAKAFIEMGVQNMTLLDASSGMLEKAKCKLSECVASGTVTEVIEAKMPPIPFPDEHFDAVLFNVVLNHLDRGNPDFPNSVKSLKEAARIIRPGGVIIVSAMPASTATRVVWFSQLNVDLTNRFIAECVPSVGQYFKMFEDADIKCIQKLNILGSDLYKSYYNLDGPLDESWRATSSYWSYATKEEVDVAVQKVQELKRKGEYEKWVQDHDQANSTGLLTIFICKPLFNKSGERNPHSLNGTLTHQMDRRDDPMSTAYVDAREREECYT